MEIVALSLGVEEVCLSSGNISHELLCALVSWNLELDGPHCFVLLCGVQLLEEPVAKTCNGNDFLGNLYHLFTFFSSVSCWDRRVPSAFVIETQWSFTAIESTKVSVDDSAVSSSPEAHSLGPLDYF